MNGRILVLYYHKIYDLKRDWNGLAVKPETFKKQMEFIKNNYTVLKGDDDWSKCNEDAIVVTFDDGFEDNYLNALPILEEVGIPATFFISTGNINTNHETWCNELVWIIFESTRIKEKFVTDSTAVQFEYETDNVYKRTELYRILRTILMRVSNDDRNKIMQDLKIWGNVSNREVRTSHRMLSQEQIKQMACSKYVTIGAHTVNHPSLGMLEYDEQMYEILESKKELESIIGKRIELFSYPFGGQSNFSKDTIRILQEVGFTKAMTTMPAIVGAGFDSYQIPRMGVKECSLDTFKKNIEFYLKNTTINEKEKIMYTFEYIGKMEQDIDLFKNDKCIMIWGAGEEGKKVLCNLQRWNVADKVKCFFDSSCLKIGTEIGGVPICDIEGASFTDNSILILAMANIGSALPQILSLNLKGLHYYL